jgi:threonine efflux protein
MDLLFALATLALVQLMAVISPGQSFVVVSRFALSSGRNAGIAAAFGMAAGTAIWATAAILGVALVLEQAAWAYGALKLAGAGYLIWLAYKMWKHAPDALQLPKNGSKPVSLRRAFVTGALTQLANPKVVIFFGSIFFALLPANPGVATSVIAVAIVSGNEAWWYSFISLLFSAKKSRGAYLRAKSAVDRVMSSALGLIGGGLAWSVLKPMLAQDNS